LSESPGVGFGENESTPEGFRQHRFAAPSGSTTILLVRHGESAPAIPDEPFELRDGHGDPPLDPVGVAQAEQVAHRLAAERVDAIYVTTLRRTHETAAPLARLLSMVPIEEPDLREVFLGEWEGGALRARAAAGDPVFEEIFRKERWDVIPGAEPYEHFDARIARGLQRIVDAHPDGRVVAVVHGGVIGQVLHRITGSRAFAFAGSDNASISEIVVSGDRTVLRRYNDTGHLV
jgi:2,3-bisphosphoglycerate-dependent phosphoglycerate mutase